LYLRGLFLKGGWEKRRKREVRGGKEKGRGGEGKGGSGQPPKYFGLEPPLISTAHECINYYYSA